MKGLVISLQQQQNSIGYCVKEHKACVGWVNKYFKDCLCNLKDEVSFGFGLVSLLCWAVAEVPQIITNFKTKSSHGVSLLFLLGWVVGDIFNLVGCLLEPATLPTQLYTAVLYTTTTIVLVLQSMYYDYFYKCWKRRADDSHEEVEEVKKPLKQTNYVAEAEDSGIPIPMRSASRRMDYYYFTSARSMAGSATPPFRSNLRPIASDPTATGHDYSSDEDDNTTTTTLNVSVSQPKPIPRSAGYGAAFLATSSNLPYQSRALVDAYVGLSGRKLLQEHGTEHSALGQCLGWMMAAVYMGGRLPQIWLNVKRGSVEGLNPFMFIFALIANVTYVGSILVRSTEWNKIKANMPWLLDAVVCVGLDLFIILQYVYYKYIHNKSTSGYCREKEYNHETNKKDKK